MTESLKKYLAFISDEKAAINEAERTIRFVISSDKLDRHGEVVEVAAVAGAIKGFAANPVCLACHNYAGDNGEPTVIGSWLTDTFKALEHTSEMDLRFAATPLAEQYWQLYKDKHMRAVSIGFRVLEAHTDKVNDRNIYVITKIELYEISCVAVGACRDALARLKLDIPDDDMLIRRDMADLRDQVDELRSMITDSISLQADLPGDGPSDLADGAMHAAPDEVTPKVMEQIIKNLTERNEHASDGR